LYYYSLAIGPTNDRFYPMQIYQEGLLRKATALAAAVK
jgi:hypothetical protein